MNSEVRRRARARTHMTDAGLDAMLVTGLVNVRYLTGFTGSAASLLLRADGAGDVLVTDGRYRDQAGRQTSDLQVRHAAAGWLAEVLGGRRRLGVEAHNLSWERALGLADELHGSEVIAAPRIIEQLRRIKDGREIASLRKACALADQAYADLLTWATPGMTERNVRTRLDRCLVDLGADDIAFATIVAAGANGAMPHHQPSAAVLAVGDLVTVDFGAVVGGYHSDMTRVFALGAVPPARRRIYDVVAGAQRAGVAAVRAGTPSGAVDDVCRRIIADAGYGERFIHGTGHGTGLEIHEDPFLRPSRPVAGATSGPSVTLRASMTATVEPGVYLPGEAGVRIEDLLVVTDTDPDVLTRTSRDLVVL